MSDDNITIRKSTFNKLVFVAIAASMIASFIGGYNLGGGGGKTSPFFQGSSSQAPPTAPFQPLQQPLVQQPVVPSAKISTIILDRAHIQGKPDAPITLVEFSDFQCPFCERFFSDTLPQILKSYVEPGKVKFVYKEYPMSSLHPNAKEAAVAAECANEQGKFWQYHNVLFRNQTTWADQSPTQVDSAFKKYASELGLNTSNFGPCLDSKRYSAIIDKDSQEGSMDGVSGTPTFYVGNDKNGYTQIAGAQPFSSFQQTIDRQLNGQ